MSSYTVGSSGDPHSHQVDGEHCQDCVIKKESPSWMRKIEIITVIAIGAFAAFQDLVLFTSSFTVGFGLGIWQCWNNQDGITQNPLRSSCASELLYRLTGVRLPEPLALFFEAAFFIHHIEHHPIAFVPFTGAVLGMATAQQTVPYMKKAIPHITSLYKRIHIFGSNRSLPLLISVQSN